MDNKYIVALIAFLGGCLISLANAVLTAREAKGESLPVPVSVIRQICNVVYFIGAYIVLRKLGIDIMVPLIGAAVGLTVPSILFAITIAKHMKGDD